MVDGVSATITSGTQTPAGPDSLRPGRAEIVLAVPAAILRVGSLPSQ
jgi:hypothetical protein